MVRATILERRIGDMIWSEIVLAITYNKNLWPTRVFENFISPIEIWNPALSNLYHLFIFGFNIYLLLYKEKQSLKSVQWEAYTFRRKLVGFNNYTIYRVPIKDKNKVIWVINLRIYKNITSKIITSLPNFKEKPTVERIQISNKQTLSNKSSLSKEKKTKSRLRQKLRKTWVIRDAQIAFKKKNKPEIIEKLTKSRVDKILKLLPKIQKKAKNAIYMLITKFTSLL